MRKNETVEKGKEKKQKFKCKKNVKKMRTFHFQETTETLRGLPKWTHFYRKKPKISPGKYREK